MHLQDKINKQSCMYSILPEAYRNVGRKLQITLLLTIASELRDLFVITPFCHYFSWTNAFGLERYWFDVVIMGLFVLFLPLLLRPWDFKYYLKYVETHSLLFQVWCWFVDFNYVRGNAKWTVLIFFFSFFHTRSVFLLFF